MSKRDPFGLIDVEDQSMIKENLVLVLFFVSCILLTIALFMK